MSPSPLPGSLRRVLLRALLLLLLVAFSVYPTWSLAGFDGTEARRVQIALEMAANDSWLVPTLGQEPTWAKPPLHYWLLRSILPWAGLDPLLLRLPAVLSAWLAAWAVGELLRRWFGARAGWIGAIGIATSPIVVSVWPTAEIDPLFAALTAVSLCCLATGVARDRRSLVVAAGLLGGLALLQKGPPYFLFAIGAWLVWWRHRRLRGFVPYALAMIGVALCYYVPLWTLAVAPAQMLTVANDESVGRLLGYEWHHVADIPAFWVRAVLVQMPLVLWCFWEWRGARDARMDPGDLMLRMASGAAVVAVAILTVFPGRSTRYILPNVILFTFAVAPAVAHFVGMRGPLPRFARIGLVTTGLVGAIALVVIPFVPRLGISALGLAAAAAVLPLVCATPRQVVIACMLLPVVASWTVGLDRAMAFPIGPRARAAAAACLKRAIVQLGVDAKDLRTAGHFDSPLLLGLGLLPPGDESGRRPWTSRWVLHESSDALPVPANYAERLRLVLPFKSFVLRERVGEGR